MKILHTIIILIAFSSPSFASCNIDTYYKKIGNQSGYELKSLLSRVLASSHRPKSYDALIGIYAKSDTDRTYENDGTLMDMYSENPSGKDPYVFKSGRKKCGNYRVESDCYNREHVFPQGLFHKRKPMRSDIFHVYPTDGKVNGHRGSYPFGEVTNAYWTSKNGSKTGPNTYSSYKGVVFEPIDEFKGDIARAMFYFATRYESQAKSLKEHPMLNGSSDQFYSNWFIKLLLKWHKQDPVSLHEIKRNEVGCQFQKNRNPFIDHPEYVQAIWEVY